MGSVEIGLGGLLRAPAPPVEVGPLPRLNTDDPYVIEAAHVLNRTVEGNAILQQLARDQVKITVFSDAEYDRRRPGTGGVYSGMHKTIELPVSSVRWAPVGATTLAHEGQHHVDNQQAGGRLMISLGVMAKSGVALLTAPLRAQNPISAAVDASMAGLHSSEVTAYQTQARVANELGLDQSAWSFAQLPGLRGVRDAAETERRILASDQYGLQGNERFVPAALAAGLMASLLTMAIGPIAAKVAPNSFLATSVLGQFLVSASVSGALLGFDLLAHRDDVAVG